MWLSAVAMRLLAFAMWLMAFAMWLLTFAMRLLTFAVWLLTFCDVALGFCDVALDLRFVALGVFGVLGTGRFLAILGDSWRPLARITGGIAGGTASRQRALKHLKISKKATSDPLKSKPGASKIKPGALQDAILKRHLI